MASSQDKSTKKATKKPKATGSKPTRRRTARPRRAPTHEAIAQRAHELYLAQGGGEDVAHWLQAERELSGA